MVEEHTGGGGRLRQLLLTDLILEAAGGCETEEDEEANEVKTQVKG
jgi:hypothetical protein